jgi:4-amino-4-deoxychorismate mutase
MSTPEGTSTPESDANGLAPFRARLDCLDGEITQLLGQRFDICREVAIYKRANAIPMMQPDRIEEVRARYIARGAELQLPADFTTGLFDLLIGASCELEDEIIDAPAGSVEGD